MGPARFAVCVLVLAGGCRPKATQPPALSHHATAASVAPDAAPFTTDRFPDEWGTCSADTYHAFGADDDEMIELADCDIDPETDDAEARPRTHVAHLVLRHRHAIIASEELGRFVRREEGSHWTLAGVVDAPDHRSLALPIYNSGSMGDDGGSSILHAYVREGDHFREIYQLGDTRVDVAIAPNRANARVLTCDGTCVSDPDKASYQDFYLSFDGTKVSTR